MKSRSNPLPVGVGAGATPAMRAQLIGAGTVGMSAAGPAASLYSLSPRKMWAFMKSQPASYWLISLYLFFEYVRPHNIYGPILGWPFASWTLMLCMAAVFVEKGRFKRPWTAGDTTLAIYTAVLLMSSITAWSPAASSEELVTYLTWILIYFLITGVVNTEKRFLVFMVGFFLYCVKMSQHGVRGWIANGFGFSSYGVSCAPAFFQNSGECGVQMAMFFPISLFFVLALRPYWTRKKFQLVALVPLSAVITIMASSSRGAQLALAATFVWLALRNVKNIKFLVVVIALAGVAYLILPEEQRQRFEAMGEDDTSVQRLTYWQHAREIMAEYPVLGIGFNNWLPYYRRYYPRQGGQVVHNIFYQAGAELGFTGLFAFIAMIVATFYVNRKTRRLARALPDGGRFAANMANGLDGALVGFMVSGFFVTVLYYPFFWINLAMTVALYNSTHYEVKRQRRALAAQAARAWSGSTAPAPAR